MQKNNPQGLSTLRVILDFGLNLMTLRNPFGIKGFEDFFQIFYLHNIFM